MQYLAIYHLWRYLRQLQRTSARGIAKYSDFGPVQGYISETVQDTASGKINDELRNHHTRRIQWYHS